MCDIANLPQASLLFRLLVVLLPCSLTAPLAVRRRVLVLFHVGCVGKRDDVKSLVLREEVHCRLAGVFLKRLFGLPRYVLSLVSSCVWVDWNW